MARVVGLDLGSYSVKAVVFETSMRGYVVRDFFSVPRPQEGERAETLKQALAALQAAHPIVADSVVVALPGPLLATHSLSLPFTDAKRLEAALPFEVEAQLPFDLDEAVYDYQVAGVKDKKSELIVGVIRKPELNSLIETLVESRIEPRVITHPAVAYQSLLINHPALFGTAPGAQPAAEAHVAIIDIGHERTSIAIGRA
ncbi:MAG: pilus assembly protein PilM, partial [Myxococcaceae bacterium]